MSAAIRNVEFEGGSASYNSDMEMRYMRLMLNSTREGNLDTLIEALTGIVTVWSFDGSPKDPEAWDSLSRTEFNKLVSAVTEDLGELGEA